MADSLPNECIYLDDVLRQLAVLQFVRFQRIGDDAHLLQGVLVLAPHLRFEEIGHADAGEYRNHRHNNQQLDQGEGILLRGFIALFPWPWPAVLHAERFSLPPVLCKTPCLAKRWATERATRIPRQEATFEVQASAWLCLTERIALVSLTS